MAEISGTTTSQSLDVEGLPPLKDILGEEMRMVQEHRGHRIETSNPHRPLLTGSAVSPHPSSTAPLPSASHAYHLFKKSRGGLVYRSSSSSDDFNKIQKQEAIVNSTGNFQCSICGWRWPRRAELQNHLKSHTGDKPHKCPDCGKSFTTPSNLVRHRRKHDSAQQG
ncbi:hypothetical protein M422DRAFT_38102 [Sphaerobolus stellatus SS14]|uniref:C2H2-type domain-containing protein n=1 Tax=Sphaerobolus stellatus (strain SS14) TaxID=990650 RepID=A0A0C9TY43_SPHS4|nr:hypothetical protein M422DRAFT_38102 [Sphaerobolus stellatus SS14]